MSDSEHEPAEWSVGVVFTLYDDRGRSPGDDEIDLLDALEAFGALGPATGGSEHGTIAARFDVVALSAPQAFSLAIETMNQALSKADIPAGDPIRAEAALFEDLVSVNAGRPAPAPVTTMGASDIAELLGVSRQRIYVLADEHEDFPRPVAQLARGQVWDRSQVLAWKKSWDRTPGRRGVTNGRRLPPGRT
ncbi:MAG: hypothetical protein WD276_00175 [Actinomycetota bacterium]